MRTDRQVRKILRRALTNAIYAGRVSSAQTASKLFYEQVESLTGSRVEVIKRDRPIYASSARALRFPDNYLIVLDTASSPLLSDYTLFHEVAHIVDDYVSGQENTQLHSHPANSEEENRIEELAASMTIWLMLSRADVPAGVISRKAAIAL